MPHYYCCTVVVGSVFVVALFLLDPAPRCILPRDFLRIISPTGLPGDFFIVCSVDMDFHKRSRRHAGDSLVFHAPATRPLTTLPPGVRRSKQQQQNRRRFLITLELAHEATLFCHVSFLVGSFFVCACVAVPCSGDRLRPHGTQQRGGQAAGEHPGGRGSPGRRLILEGREGAIRSSAGMRQGPSAVCRMCS